MFLGIRNGVEAQLGISDGRASEKRLFQADPDLTLGDQLASIMELEEYPQQSVTTHSLFTQLICEDVRPRHIADSLGVWEVDVTYSLTPINSTAPAPQWGDPPEKWYPILRYGTESRLVNADVKRTSLLTRSQIPWGSVIPDRYVSKGDSMEIMAARLDFTGGGFSSGFMTAAGEVYSSPAIQVREILGVMELTRYEREFFIGDDQVTWPEYQLFLIDKVNSKPWYRYPPRTVLLEDMTVDTIWRYELAYNKVTYRFKVDQNFPGRDSYRNTNDLSENGGPCMTSSHDPIIMHGGFIDRFGLKIKDGDGNEMSNPWPIAPCNGWEAIMGDADYLTNLGAPFPRDTYDQSEAVYLPFVCYRQKDQFDFNALGFDLDRYYPTQFAT